MTVFRMRSALLVALAVLLTGMAALASAPVGTARADTPVALGSGWIFDLVSGLGNTSAESPFTFTGPAQITVVDTLCRGDEFEVVDGVTSLGFTSEADSQDCTDPDPTADPDEAILDPSYSRGVFVVGPGPHSIGIKLFAPAYSNNAASFYVRFDPVVNGPHWELVAKVGGGNVLSPYLPDYTPNTWATRAVVLYLDCVAGDAPIDREYGDRSVPFSDGIRSFSMDSSYVCVDENGVSADPIVDYGLIMVDTKAPTCKATPSTHFIPRGAAQVVVFNVVVTEATSGIDKGVLKGTASGGATVFVTIDGSLPNLTASFQVTMPNSTAGKVDGAFTLTDHAGNVGSCAMTVRAR